MQPKNKEELIERAAAKYALFMDELLPDWKDDPNSKDTPLRVAKAFVNDLWKGKFSEEPKITSFENTENYNGVVFQGNIEVVSMCSHHHLAFTGVCHIAYLPSEGEFIGLSKLNRVVEYFSRRPQVQENLTVQIHKYLDKVLKGNKGIAVMIEAKHTCCSSRGVGHDSTMMTSQLSGSFLEEDSCRSEYYQFINYLKK